MVKHIAKIVLGEELYNIKDTEVRGDLNNHASNTDIHVTAAEKEYWNSKVNPPSYLAPTAKQLTYTGSAQDLLNAGSAASGTIQYSTDENNWSTSIPQATDAGTYTTYWRFIGSESTYVDSTAISVTIAKVTPTVTNPSANILTYNGESQNLVGGGSTNFGILQYSTDGENWSTSVPSATNAGSYVVYYRVVGDNNINDVAQASVNCSIAKATPTVTAPTPKTLTYNGSSQELANAGSTDWGTIQYSSSENGTYSSTIPSETNANVTYKVWYKVVGDSNINDVAAASIDCMIAEKRVTTPTIILSQDSFIYTGSAFQPTVTVEDSGTTVDPSEYTVEYLNNTNVGTATVVIVDKTAGNYYIEGTTTFSITKANPTYTAPVATDPTYTGSAQNLLTSGSTSDGTIQYSSDNSTWSTTIPQLTNADTYIVYWKLVGDSNHNDVASTSVSCAISKAIPTYTAPTAKTLTYTGSALDLLNAGSSSDGTIQYSDDGGTTWSTTISQGTNAGSYTPQWKLVGDNNHNDVSAITINVSIAKAAPVYTAPTAKSGLVYNASAQGLLNAGTSNDGTISYSNDNENWGSSIPTGTNAGNYTVYWKLTGDANHNDVASTAISVSIAKVTPTVTAPTAKTGLVYTDSAQLLVNAGFADFGTLQYSLDDETYSTSVPSGTNAGDYSVYYRVIGDSNVDDVAAQSVSCSIGKADRTVTISGNQTNMTPGQSNTITVTATGSPASSLISVTSSNTAVATISGTTVNAVGGGTTTITATVASDTNYNSGSTSYSLNVAWPNGIYAAYADGSMRTAENADANAIGVAVITDNCKFIIDKTNNTSAAWDSQYSTNGVIAGCFATDDTNTAKTNYTGVSNTNAIAAVASGGEAAKYCRGCSKTIAGKTVYGYLGACGEWLTAYDNKTTVNSIMSTIGGTAISDYYYWTSALRLSYSRTAWTLYWTNGLVNRYGKDNGYLVRPLYEIS